MDVAVVADRTSSMSSTNIKEITGIKGMFQVMTPSQQYVALGTIGWSSPTVAANCKSMDSSSNPANPSDTSGLWIPVPFSNDYLNAGTATVNTSSPLVQACWSQFPTGNVRRPSAATQGACPCQNCW
jgi:hypothetical protein